MRRVGILSLTFWVWFGGAAAVLRGQAPSSVDLTVRAKSLVELQRWDEVVQMLAGSHLDLPELCYYFGIAQARLQNWAEARAAFERGRSRWPSDKRFPLELAGLAYRQKDFPRSKALLKEALALDSGDPYANDFLATLYSLQGNQEAALKYWNRARKPDIERVEMEPAPRVDPVLLDHALAFSPSNVLRLEDVLTTRARLAQLGIFARSRFELIPRTDGKFDLNLRLSQKPGWSDNKLAFLSSLLRGAPYQTVFPEFNNLAASARNSSSLVRWDARKRRLWTSFSAPIGSHPEWHYRLRLDGRSEDWDLHRQLPGTASGDVKMKSLQADAGIRSVVNGRWSWETGVILKSRDFRNAPTGADTAGPFTGGLSVEQSLGTDLLAVYLPDQRFEARFEGRFRWGALMSTPSNRYSLLSLGLAWTWFPGARGDDWIFSGAIRSGASFGGIPFDELFSLGLERDNDSTLRAHGGTVAGRKGPGPLGTSFVLVKTDLQRTLVHGGYWEVAVGPFLDTGRTYDRYQLFGSTSWLWDIGLQVRVSFLDAIHVHLSYGKDLQTGRNVFHVR